MDYTIPKVGDLVNYTSTDPMAWIIRSRTAGIKRIFDKTVATHTGIVCKMEDQLLVCGMRKIISIESLDDKEIISISRNDLITDEARVELNKAMAYDIRKCLDYDYAGLLQFIFPDIKQAPSKFYCSEYYVFRTKKWIIYTRQMYSPFDLQIDPRFKEVWKR
jgi:hypothetical protein